MCVMGVCTYVTFVLFIDGSPYGMRDSVRLRPPLTFVTTTSTTTKSPTEIRQHLTSQSREELVKPTKLPPKPMHTVDLLTEMHLKDAAGGESSYLLCVSPSFVSRQIDTGDAVTRKCQEDINQICVTVND